jgi:hypothetical protein
VRLLSKKKLQKEEDIRRNNNFNSMLQNIKNAIKENEKKGREARNTPEPLYNN